MLHQVNPPQCSNELQAILRFQREVLDFACTITDSSLLDQALVTAHFVVTGDWLCSRLWQNGKPRPFCSALSAVIDHVKGDAALRTQILQAFDHDTTFNRDVDDGNFRFTYNTNALGIATNEILRPLLEAFYGDLLKAGYPPTVHGGTAKLDRDFVVDAFWKANPHMLTCPACDNNRPDSVDGKVYADEDHFFPKSKYPFLSVHEANLLPVCLECNRIFKIATDPIDDHYNAPLPNSFHPYHSPAVLHIDVQTTRIPPGGERKIQIIDRRSMPSRRVQQLNTLFKIEKRWEGRSEASLLRIIETLRGQARCVKKLGTRFDTEDNAVEIVRSSLEDALSEKRNNIGKGHWCVLETSYLQYALSNDEEFEFLVEQFLAA